MPQFKSYHLHLPFYHLDDSKNLRLLYLTRVLKDLVNKVSLFFLPIFLYNLGSHFPVDQIADFSLSELQKGMLTIGVFFFFSRLTSIISAVPIGKIIAKVGFQRSFSYSYFLRLISFICLYLSPEYPVLIILAMFFDAFQTNFFWNSYHTVLSQNTEIENLGQDLSLQQFFLQLIAVITPAISGALALWMGLEILFLFGLVVTLFAFIATSQMQFNEPTLSTVSWKEFKEWIHEPDFVKLAVALGGRYVHDSVLFLWPLYLFLILGSVDKVGYLYTVSLFIALLVTIFMGVFIDKSKSKKPFYLSGSVLSILWLLRTQTFNIINLALIDAADKLTANFHWLYFDLVMMRRGKGSKALSYFVYREVIMSFAGILFWLLFCLFFMFSSSWNTLFVLASFCVALTLLINDKKKFLKV